MSPFTFNYYKPAPKWISDAWRKTDAGKVFKPIVSGPAKAASDPLDTQQTFTAIGEAVPIVFCRFRNSKGGILISPGATEARYEADDFNNVTVSYHYVLSEGQVASVQVRDVRQSSCRVGTHTQTYNRRAGTWTPGNFIEDRTLFQFTFDGTTWYNATLDDSVWRFFYNGLEYSCCGTGPRQVLYLRNNTDYVKPDAPVNCGSVGSYPGMSTLSFTNTIPDGFDQWNRQVHIFMRGGMYVTRLYDNVVGPSDNFADLVKWLFENTARVPVAMIDTAGLTAAATFLEYNGLTCNCNLTSKINLPQMLASWAPYFLLGESSDAGKKGLRPLLPTLANGAINTGVIADEYTFTENVIILDTLEIDYSSLSDRQPFVVQVIWRQQLEGDIGIIRTYERRFTGTAEAGPYESHDLSEFCTSEDHAAKVGAYILGKRVYPTHSIRFSARPQAHNAILAAGSIIRVRLERSATNFVASVHDYLYQVTNITETLSGDVSYDAVHFPVDSQGRSLIALDVAAAVGSGTLLTSNRTAPSCDKNSPTDTTVPPEEFSLPDENVDPINTATPSGDPGTGGFGDSPPTLPLTIIEDAYDNTSRPFPNPTASIGGVLELSPELTTSNGWSFGSDADGWQPFSYGTIRNGRAVVVGSADAAVYPNGNYTIRAVRTNTQTGVVTVYDQYIPSNPSPLSGLDNWRWTAAGGSYVNRSYYPQYPYRIDRLFESGEAQLYDVRAIVAGLGGAPTNVGPFDAATGDMRVTGAYNAAGALLISYL